MHEFAENMMNGKTWDGKKTNKTLLTYNKGVKRDARARRFRMSYNSSRRNGIGFARNNKTRVSWIAGKLFIAGAAASAFSAGANYVRAMEAMASNGHFKKAVAHIEQGRLDRAERELFGVPASYRVVGSKTMAGDFVSAYRGTLGERLASRFMDEILKAWRKATREARGPDIRDLTQRAGYQK